MKAAKAEAEVEAELQAALAEAEEARAKAEAEARTKADVVAGISPPPVSTPFGRRLQVDIAPTGQPNFNSRRKLADVGDDLKPAFDTVTAELSGSA